MGAHVCQPHAAFTFASTESQVTATPGPKIAPLAHLLSLGANTGCWTVKFPGRKQPAPSSLLPLHHLLNPTGNFLLYSILCILLASSAKKHEKPTSNMQASTIRILVAARSAASCNFQLCLEDKGNSHKTLNVKRFLKVCF